MTIIHGSFSGPEPTDWKVDDLVVVSEFSGFPAWANGVVYKITKRPARANEVNYVAKPASGVGRGLRGPAWAFARHDGPAPEIAPVVNIRCGTVVRVLGKDGLFVVTKIDPAGTEATVLHLNGDGTGYRGVALTRLAKVEVQEVE